MASIEIKYPESRLSSLHAILRESSRIVPRSLYFFVICIVMGQLLAWFDVKILKNGSHLVSLVEVFTNAAFLLVMAVFIAAALAQAAIRATWKRKVVISVDSSSIGFSQVFPWEFRRTTIQRDEILMVAHTKDGFAVRYRPSHTILGLEKTAFIPLLGTDGQKIIDLLQIHDRVVSVP